ncbi:MAG: SDR family NAD(P)-dependent oxidoreductase [Roseibium sp.]
MPDFSGKFALVTGTNQGLGKELTRQLASAGATVFATALDVAQGKAALSDFAGDIRVIELDLGKPASITAVVGHVRNAAGKLDILVNNAAVLIDMMQQPSEVSDKTLRINFEVNFFGPWQLTRETADLIKASQGRVLNLATQVATLTQLADPDSPLKDDICPAYQSSKIALNAMTVLYAKEFRESGAKINSVCPGWVMTDMGHNEDLPDYGDAAKPMTPKDAIANYLWLLDDSDNVPTGGFFTGKDTVNW